MAINKITGDTVQGAKRLKIHNKSDKSDNVIECENEIYMQCEIV